jgi:hypothetical protein
MEHKTIDTHFILYVLTITFSHLWSLEEFHIFSLFSIFGVSIVSNKTHNFIIYRVLGTSS